MNAYRICNELKIGIKQNSTKLTSEGIRQAIHAVFKDDIYLKNVLELSKMSRKYNGIQTACKLIEEFINSN